MTVDESPATERSSRSPRDERWYLTDERDFLQRSLADADRELQAGDLSTEDHAVLVARDRARLAEVEEELARARQRRSASKAAPTERVQSVEAERAPMPLWRRLGIIGSASSLQSAV